MGDSDLGVAMAAASAAAVVRSYYGRTLPRLDKGGGDFATVADVEAEERIIDIVRTARPGDAVLGEESGLVGAVGAERTWLVDPFCGTLNFAAHTPLVAVNVALRTPSGVMVAASADPFTGEVFWTDGRRVAVRHAGADVAMVPSAVSGLVEVHLTRRSRPVGCCGCSPTTGSGTGSTPGRSPPRWR